MIIIIINNDNNDDDDDIVDDVDDSVYDDGVHLEALHQLVVTHQVMEKPLYMEYNLYNVTL